MNHLTNKPLFPSNQAALDHYLEEARKLELKYGRSLENLWDEAEHSGKWTEELSEIHSLYRRIQTLKALVKQDQENPS
jgi:hypothetical protein